MTKSGATFAVAGAALGLAIVTMIQEPWLASHPRREWFVARHQAYRELADYYLIASEPDDLLMIDEIGIVGFHAWPRRLRDINGLIHRDMTRDMLMNNNAIAAQFNPRWVKTYQPHGQYFVADSGSFIAAWELQKVFNVGLLYPALYRRVDRLPDSVNHGIYPVEDWGGVPVRWTRRRAEFLVQPGEARALRVKYYVGHADVSPERPVTVSIFVDDEPVERANYEAQAYDEKVLPMGGAGGDVRVRIEVDRTWVSPEGRHLGICLYPLTFDP